MAFWSQGHGEEWVRDVIFIVRTITANPCFMIKITAQKSIGILRILSNILPRPWQVCRNCVPLTAILFLKNNWCSMLCYFTSSGGVLQRWRVTILKVNQLHQYDGWSSTFLIETVYINCVCIVVNKTVECKANCGSKPNLIKLGF